MKRIYNYLFPALLTLFAVVACDEDNEEIVSMSYTDPVATVTKIEPAEGYVGNEFTISGDDFGIRTEDIKVYIGSQATTVVSCADNAIVAKVPESATNGKITVEVFGQRVETDFAFRVLGKPGVSAVKPSYGFPGASIVFEGQEFVSTKSLFTLTFGTSTDKAEIVGTPTDTEFKAIVPETAVSGIMSLVMAEQVIDMASYPFTVLKHATIDELKEGDPVPSGFAGSTFTITGTNFVQELLKQPVEALSPLKVTFTKTGGEPIEAEIDMDGLNETSIPLTVPALLEAGDYTITVITSFETIGTKLTYTVLPMPVVTGISTKAGYINAEVTIIGQNFGENVDNIQVSFGDIVCEKVTLNEDGNIVVNVPKGIPTGKNTVSLKIRDTEIELGEFSSFDVWETPEIISIQTPYVYEYGTLVKGGEEITFVGHGFGTNKESVSVSFEGVTVPVEINSIAPTKIAVNVPQGFNGGKVTMTFLNIDAPVESGDLYLFPENGDITQYVLKNYKQPFEYVREGGDNGFYKKGEWAKATYWNVRNSNLTAGEGGAVVDLAFKTKFGDGSDAGLALQTDWGFDNPKNNGKIYQTSYLSKGKYKLTAHVYEYANKGFTGYVAVCKGDEIANTDDISTNSIAREPISGMGDVEVDIDIVESTDVSIGFVCTITEKQGRAKIDSFKLELAE